MLRVKEKREPREMGKGGEIGTRTQFDTQIYHLYNKLQ